MSIFFDWEMKKIYIKNRRRKPGAFQFYMPQFVEAAVRQGMIPKHSWVYDACFKLNDCLGKCRQLFRRKRKKSCGVPKSTAVVSTGDSGGGLFQRVTMALYPVLGRKNKKKAIIITSRGETLFMNAFPFFYKYEIIPMLWDVWPSTWNSLYRDLRLLGVKRLFVTVREMAEKISCELGIETCWIPEGIDIAGYAKGDNLSARTIDVYELGRQKREYHQVLEELARQGILGTFCRNQYDERGGLVRLAFPTTGSLLENLPDVKIVVSFPQVDTHPDKAGTLDTLTQRYWEAMLCRCLMVGRAPQELIELIGYNPVVDVDWKEPDKQMERLLQHISDYQELVDRNYAVAQEMAPWDSRMKKVFDMLRNS